MKRTLLTAAGALLGGFGTLLACVIAGQEDTPPYVLAIAAFGALLGALLPRLATDGRPRRPDTDREPPTEAE